MGGVTVCPSVSVAIATYSPDRIRGIRACLDSLASSSVEEVIVVVDHAPQLLARLRQLLPGACVVQNVGQKGLSAARNTAVYTARGSVIAFLDDDVVVEPTWLSNLLRPYDSALTLGVGGGIHPDWVAGKPSWFPEEYNWVVGCTYRGLPLTAAPVRNLIGANMSFRREPLIEAGGFRSDLGRVDALPLGCEETELCIRLARHNPRGQLIYEPRAAVRHTVPPERGTARYFHRRCFGEGLSKARMSAAHRSTQNLSTERRYVTRTLPSGVASALSTTARGDLSASFRAAAITSGLVVTTAGYLRGRATRPGRSADRRG